MGSPVCAAVAFLPPAPCTREAPLPLAVSTTVLTFGLSPGASHSAVVPKVPAVARTRK